MRQDRSVCAETSILWKERPAAIIWERSVLLSRFRKTKAARKCCFEPQFLSIPSIPIRRSSMSHCASDAEADAEFHAVELLAGAAVISESHIYAATEIST